MDKYKDWPKINTGARVPAYPPEDYTGMQADWLVELDIRGVHWGEYITQEEWWEILEACEDQNGGSSE